MKILVCGNHKIGKTSAATPHHLAGEDTHLASQQRVFVYDYLSRLHELSTITRVFGGDEGGAERLGLHWAKMNNIPSTTIKRLKFEPSKTSKIVARLLGGRLSAEKETTVERNQRMLDEAMPDLVVAFGTGKYTERLVQDARDRGIEVLEVEAPANEFSRSRRVTQRTDGG
jgi:hypothetical protein